MDWLNQYFKAQDEFPRPDWEAITEVVEKNHQDADKQELWCEIARSWMDRLIPALGHDYKYHESDNFILLTSGADKQASSFLKFLERALVKIKKTLTGIASDEGYGKYVVMIFDDIDQYYSYLSFFYEHDGEYGLSAGIYLNRGYGHFAFPKKEIVFMESIAVHEMTHALLAHLPIPGWLNEGIAMGVEDHLTGLCPLRMDNEKFAQHQSFWGESEIQEFWQGDSFYRTDEGQDLSYHLAQFAVSSLSQDYDDFAEFVNKAHYSDGGENAANEVYDGSLGNLIANYFGEGDWTPRPENWVDKGADEASQLDM